MVNFKNEDRRSGEKRRETGNHKGLNNSSKFCEMRLLNVRVESFNDVNPRGNGGTK